MSQSAVANNRHGGSGARVRRVLYIAQHFAPLTSWKGSYQWWTTSTLRQKGWNVMVLTGPDYIGKVERGGKFVSRATMAGIDLRILDVDYRQEMGVVGRYWSFFRFMVGATIVALTCPRPDVVAIRSPPLTVALPGIFASLVRGVPFVLDVRDLWPDAPIELGFVRGGLVRAALLWFERLSYRVAKVVVVASPGVRDRLIEKGMSDSRVMIVPNCADNQLFGEHGKGDEFRRRNDLEDKFICIHAGSMGFINWLDTLLDAAKILRDSRPDIVFLLVGDGSQRPSLERRVRDERLTNVRFLGPFPKPEMPACMAAADIGIVTVANFPIMELNSSNKFFDYLASGKPVLLNYGGWQLEWLSRYRAGEAVPSGNPQAMADAIAGLEADRERLERMGRNARRLAEEQFDRRRHMDRMEQVIRKAADAGPANTPPVERWPFEASSLGRNRGCVSL